MVLTFGNFHRGYMDRFYIGCVSVNWPRMVTPFEFAGVKCPSCHHVSHIIIIFDDFFTVHKEIKINKKSMQKNVSSWPCHEKSYDFITWCIKQHVLIWRIFQKCLCDGMYFCCYVLLLLCTSVVMYFWWDVLLSLWYNDMCLCVVWHKGGWQYDIEPDL